VVRSPPLHHLPCLESPVALLLLLFDHSWHCCSSSKTQKVLRARGSNQWVDGVRKGSFDSESLRQRACDLTGRRFPVLLLLEEVLDLLWDTEAAEKQQRGSERS
jgi:hypothetical protein